MEKQNIAKWYYEQGLHELLELIKDHLAFFWRFFSVVELFLTLFSPWHRDVTVRAWRGWNPAKSLEIIVTNIISRFIGAVVRTCVIAMGLLTVLAAFAAGTAFLFLWVVFPLLIISLAVIPFLMPGIFFLAVASCVSFLFVVFFAYRNNTRKRVFELEPLELSKHPVFERICARIGILKEDFPVEVLENEDILSEFLNKYDISIEEFFDVKNHELSRWDLIENKKKFWSKENLSMVPAIGVQWRYGYTVHLDLYAQDLSEHDFTEYRDCSLIGRESILEVTRLVLERPDQNCVLLVGQSGIGKKTLIHSLGGKVRRGEMGGYFEGKRIMLLDLGRVISDSINKGEDVENVLRILFMEASYAGNVILAIEHLEHYLGKEGNTFHPDISAVLGEFLGIPTLQIIATSTPKEYHALIEKQEAVGKYFEVVEFTEPSDKETMEILLSKLEPYEGRNVIFSYTALRTIIADAQKYNWEFPMPERAIDLMMEILTYWSNSPRTMFILPETVEEYLSMKTGIPQGEVGDSERKKLLDLENSLHRHVIGQEEAVGQIAKALRRMRSGVGNANRPIGSFLFLGPTGVGKTETAKALARAYFGDENHMIRLDMSEYQSPTSIDRLIGSQSLGQPGQLAIKAKENPYTLLLLDEIEKAYPTVLDLFLQVLDEGFMTDAFGEKINFRNMIIIATSNAGAPLIKRFVEEGYEAEEIKQKLIDHIIEEGIFRVEFLNRFESVIFFRPLNGGELKSVARLILDKFARRVGKEKNIDVSFGESVIDNVIREGYNPIFGARSLNRYVENSVEDLIARKIIAGEVKRGEKISIDL